VRVLRVGLILALVASFGGAFLAWQWWHAPPHDRAHVITLIIVPGTSLIALSEQLHAAGLVSHAEGFRIGAQLSGDAPKVKAGEFEFRPGLSPAQVLDVLVRGEAVQHSISLIEGWTVAQALAEVRSSPLLTHELQEADQANLLAMLGFEDQPAEGWLFPDTYLITRGASDVELLRRAHEQMVATLDMVWRGRDAGLPYETRYELLIVASLIEKETGLASDRADISQVFASRLVKNMRLQTDPSVIYGLGEQFDGNLTRVNMRIDTPYNTYTRHGLTPTPIALPGIASLTAAAHPGSNDYLYFVAKGDGSSAFSRTLEEHLDAVRRYQLR
jgi:UPF0755 protein